MAESDNILTKLHDLLVYVIPQINKFPRDQRFVLGDRLETKLLDVQESCLRAYYSRDKRGHLLEANLRLEVGRHLVRLAHALRLFSNHTYGVLAAKMDEVGRMIGGWLKTQAGAGATGGNGAPTFLSASSAAAAEGSREGDGGSKWGGRAECRRSGVTWREVSASIGLEPDYTEIA
jgi:hypothetical protein